MFRALESNIFQFGRKTNPYTIIVTGSAIFGIGSENSLYLGLGLGGGTRREEAQGGGPREPGTQMAGSHGPQHQTPNPKTHARDP